MDDKPKRMGAAAWTVVVALVLLVTYPLSFGPACWLVERDIVPLTPTARWYSPILRLPSPADRVIVCYGEFWTHNPLTVFAIDLAALLSSED